MIKPIPGPWKREGLLLLLYAYAAALVTYPLVTYWKFSTYPSALVPDLMAGTAYKPFVFRRLVPDLLLWLCTYLPQPILEIVAALYGERSLFPYVVSPGLGTVLVLFCGIAFACFFGFACALRRLIRHFYPELPPGVVHLAPLGAVVLLPLFFRYYAYPYDPSTLLFSTLGLLFLATDRPLYYAAVFAASCYNRESSVLLVILFVIFYAPRMSRGRTAAWAALQFGFWAGVTGLIRYRFQHNPADPRNPKDFHLFDHNLLLPYARPWSFLYMVVVVGVFWWLIALDWREKPLALRRALLFVAAPLFAASLFIGFIDELRVYFDVYALLFLLILPAMGRVFGEHEAKPQSA